MTGASLGVEPGAYAALWRRLAAFVIDFLIMLAPDFALSPLFGPVGGFVSGIAIDWLYWAGLESSAAQATVGKWVFRIRVTGLEGGRISFAKATVRFWAKALSALPLGAGFVMAAFTKRKQALHDRIAGTLVVAK